MRFRRDEARERVNPVTGDMMLAKFEIGYSPAYIAAFHGYSRADTVRAIKLAKRRREERGGRR